MPGRSHRSLSAFVFGLMADRTAGALLCIFIWGLRTRPEIPLAGWNVCGIAFLVHFTGL